MKQNPKGSIPFGFPIIHDKKYDKIPKNNFSNSGRSACSLQPSSMRRNTVT